jgi:hypothetical protein
MKADDRGSVTIRVDALRAGDQEAARQLWQRYFQSLVRLGRSRLQAQARAAADEEDVALSAFDTFCDGMSQGRFPDLADRDDLWRLLVTIAARKASDQNRGLPDTRLSAGLPDTRLSAGRAGNQIRTYWLRECAP